MRSGRSCAGLAVLAACGLYLAGAIGLPNAALAQQPFEARRTGAGTPAKKPPDRFLCNRYMREFDTKLRTLPEPDGWNVKRAKVLRQEGSILCRQGRRGEGQLKLEAAIRGLGFPKEPKPSTLIDQRIEAYDARKAIIDLRKADPAFTPPLPPYDRLTPPR